jgi:DNA modification methylase
MAGATMRLRGKLKSIHLVNDDCLVAMKKLQAGSVDLILTDLPYGTTQNKWDIIIPFEPLWQCFWSVLKPTGVIALTASQPFTSLLVCSQLAYFKYAWVWDKVNRISGHLNSKKQPLRIVEDVVLFYKQPGTYNPQMTKGKPYVAVSKGRKSSNYGSQVDGVKTVNNGDYYPRNLISIAADERGTEGRIHPNQKPIALMEYLIKTYSNERDTILDCCMGSGTTGVACKNLNRRFIGIEKDPTIFQTAKERINAAPSR